MIYQQQTSLIQPTEIDILCGRGKAYSNHPGNLQFSERMRSSLQQYTDSPRRIDRSILLSSLVDEFSSKGARMLRKDKKTNEWIVLNNDQCHEKVGHALRDLTRDMRRQAHSKGAILTSQKKQEERPKLNLPKCLLQRELSVTMSNPLNNDTTLPLTEELLRFVLGDEEPQRASITPSSSAGDISISLPRTRMVSMDNTGKSLEDQEDTWEDTIITSSEHYAHRNSFKAFADFDILENRHDLTMEDSLTDFQF